MVEGTVETRDTDSERGAAEEAPVAGAVLVHAGERPTCIVKRLPVGVRSVFGRGSFAGAVDDARASREHAFVTRKADSFLVEDNESRNGTSVNGTRITGPAHGLKDGAVVRVGHSVIVLFDDVRRFEIPKPFEREAPPGATSRKPLIVGPTLERVHARIARASAAGEAVLFCGETGSGKELAARAFHEATGRTGPLVAVNCAAIPMGVAERLLFGAKRGAYSGADADADGYLQAADRGTLFLDEIAELDPSVQAKLLRAIETQEVLAVGASRPRKVDVRVCSATHKDLKREIEAGRFRQDLYFRIGRPEVVIPPLRERLEEIPWLAATELAPLGLALHASFVEACLLRPWPGNVRELLAEVRRAAQEARARNDGEVRSSDLDPAAGRPLVGARPASADVPLVVRTRDTAPADDERYRRALEDNKGNVAAAARALGIHRNQLRRWVDRQRVSGSGPEKP